MQPNILPYKGGGQAGAHFVNRRSKHERQKVFVEFEVLRSARQKLSTYNIRTQKSHYDLRGLQTDFPVIAEGTSEMGLMKTYLGRRPVCTI